MLNLPPGTDENALLSTAAERSIRVFGAVKDGLATQPVRLVRPGLPPAFLGHGDKDTLVPYQQSVRLHKALDAAGVPNRLVTMLGAGHGGFTYEENQRAWAAIREFLGKHVRGLKDPTPAK